MHDKHKNLKYKVTSNIIIYCTLYPGTFKAAVSSRDFYSVRYPGACKAIVLSRGLQLPDKHHTFFNGRSFR